MKQAGGKRKKDETVRYVSDNEMIIQPLNVREPKRSGVSTLINLGIDHAPQGLIQLPKAFRFLVRIRDLGNALQLRGSRHVVLV